MLDKPALGRLLDYTEWANQHVVRAAAVLSVDDWRRDLGSSHGGVRGTLAHMLFAEWVWLERWKGVSPTKRPDEAEFADILALRDRWRVVEEHRRDWFANLRDGAVAELVRYRMLDGTAAEAPLWQLMQHVVNHATYHRGQVVTMLRQLGAKAVSTDLLFYDREKAAARTQN
jgi:uncharacterized damage-inducible protein DinB